MTPQDQIELKKLLFNPQWKVAEALIEELVQEIRGESPVADTEWETVRKTLQAAGEERGLRRFQQRLFDLASSAHD